MRTINSTFDTESFKIEIKKDDFRRGLRKEEKEKNEIGLYQEFYKCRQL